MPLIGVVAGVIGEANGEAVGAGDGARGGGGANANGPRRIVFKVTAGKRTQTDFK